MRFLLALSLTLTACDTIQTVDTFDLQVIGVTAIAGSETTEAPLGRAPALIGLSPLDIGSLSTFRQRGYAVDLVDRLHLESAELHLRPAEGQDLAFFEEVRLLAEVGSARKLLARGAPRPGEQVVGLEVTADDLHAWFIDAKGHVHAELLDAERPPRRVEIEVRLNFSVGVGG